MQFFRESMLELLIQTSTNLPPDVRRAMGVALKREEPRSQAGQALAIIGENIDMAYEDEGPICQDTGFITFEIRTPVGANHIVMKKPIEEAVAEATRRGKLRPNSVDSITGKNTGNNLGPGTPVAQLEAGIMEEANKIGVGTMGFGGKASLIGCKIAAANRLPASFFVSVAYDCWAFRRLGVILDAESGAIKRWLYRDPDRPVERLVREGAGFTLSGREIRLEPPLSEERVRALKVGDVVLINGPIVTGRDALHHYLLHHDAPCDLSGG